MNNLRSQQIAVISGAVEKFFPAKMAQPPLLEKIVPYAYEISPFKISGKVAVGEVMNSTKFSGHPYIGASRGRLCDSSAFLLTCKNV